jgi:type IV secretion system protein VirB10
MTTGRSRASRSRRCGCAPSRRASRLSRKVLAGLGLAASLGVGGAWSMRSRPGTAAIRAGTLFHRQPLDTGWIGWPAQGLYRRAQTRPAAPGDLGRPILNAQNGGHPFRHREVLLRRQSAPARRSNVGRRNWSGSHRAPFASTETRPANTATAAQPSATAARNRSRQPRSHRSQPHRRRRIGSSPSTRRQTSAPSRPIGRSAASNVASGRAVISAALITGIRSDLPGRSPRR